MIPEWSAQVELDFMTGGRKLWLARRHGDYNEVLAGDGTWRTVPVEVAIDFKPPVFPPGALEAVAAAVKPGPSAEVVAEIRAALDHERLRVDAVLRTLAPPLKGES